MSEDSVDTQVISNLIVRNEDGAVLLVRYDPENEKWWLPGNDVAPFTHPDDTAQDTLAAFEGLQIASCRLNHVESFRGRRGWHLVFHYDVRAAHQSENEPGGACPAQWFPAGSLPNTMHGNWEKQAVARVLDDSEA